MSESTQRDDNEKLEAERFAKIQYDENPIDTVNRLVGEGWEYVEALYETTELWRLSVPETEALEAEWERTQQQ
jgi:hypothetical protein